MFFWLHVKTVIGILLNQRLDLRDTGVSILHLTHINSTQVTCPCVLQTVVMCVWFAVQRLLVELPSVLGLQMKPFWQASEFDINLCVNICVRLDTSLFPPHWVGTCLADKCISCPACLLMVSLQFQSKRFFFMKSAIFVTCKWKHNLFNLVWIYSTYWVIDLPFNYLNFHPNF